MEPQAASDFYKYLFQRIEAVKLRVYNTVIHDSNYDIIVLNEYNVTIKSQAVSKNILVLEQNSTGCFLKGTINSTSPPAGSTFCVTFENVRYRNATETAIQEGTLHVYKTSSGVFGVFKGVSGAGNLLSKLDNAVYATLKGKVNQLDNVLKSQFLDDFANASDDVLKKLQNDNLFDVWKNDIRSSNIDELITFKGRGNLRNEYITAVNSIANKAAELKALGKTDIEIAQEVFNLRRKTTIDFKGATPDDMLDVIFEFNNIRYTQTGLGDKWGLSWNGAVSKATKDGVTDYSRIISGASTPLGDKQVLGKALYDVVGGKTLPILQKYRMTSLID